MTRPTVQALLPWLAPAQILLVQRRGFLAWAIRRISGSPWTHAALIDQTASGIAITVEAADLEGVKSLRLERYFEDASVTGLKLRDDSTLTPAERQAIMRVAWLNVGKRYDVPQILGIWARRRLPWLFGQYPLSRNRLDSAGRLICSESVTIAYQLGAGRYLAPPHVAIGNVDPGHLNESLKLYTRWEWKAG